MSVLVDSLGVSDLELCVIGPVKIVTRANLENGWPDRVEYAKFWDDQKTRIACGGCPNKYSHYSEFRDFEKLELAARPRINLELASKIPGDVHVVTWK